MAFKFGIIGCGSIARDHATIIKKLGHQVVLGITKNRNSKNWKSFKRIFPEIKFANKISSIGNKPIHEINKEIIMPSICSKKNLDIVKQMLENIVQKPWGTANRINDEIKKNDCYWRNWAGLF